MNKHKCIYFTGAKQSSESRATIKAELSYPTSRIVFPAAILIFRVALSEQAKITVLYEV